MKITVSSTSKVVEVDGVQARLWEGRTESGIPVHCFIVRIAAPADADLAEFDRELRACAEPSAAVQAIPLRLIL